MHSPRSLALATVRHPFRRAVVESRGARARTRDEEDVRLFALSFTAFFICFYTFIF